MRMAALFLYPFSRTGPAGRPHRPATSGALPPCFLKKLAAFALLPVPFRQGSDASSSFDDTFHILYHRTHVRGTSSFRKGFLYAVLQQFHWEQLQGNTHLSRNVHGKCTETARKPAIRPRPRAPCRSHNFKKARIGPRIRHTLAPTATRPRPFAIIPTQNSALISPTHCPHRRLPVCRIVIFSRG